MRDHNREFCHLIAKTLDCPGPVYEFGSYQVQGQEGYANLRELFPGRTYVGCDMRPGPGVDRVEDVSDINLPDQSAGTVLCVETFEHVFEVRRAFDEVFRILKPGGMFVITTPLNFRIHGYPDDYWRMTPSCLRRMLSPYAARLTGYQGYNAFPHSIMGIAIKYPAPIEIAKRLETLTAGYDAWLAEAKSALSPAARLRRTFSSIYRSKGERRQIRDYYSAGWTVDLDEPLTSAVSANERPADITASF
jgi:SAM-dependent methyltransferase